MKTRIIKVGNSRGILLPGYILKKLNLTEGDTLYLSFALHPPQITLHPSETEAEYIGLTTEDRTEIEQFLDSYQHIFRKS